VQDAVNLGWKLVATLHGWAPDGLLDTYHPERHPVGAGVLRNTRAQGLIYLTADEMEPLRSVLREIVQLPEAATLLAGMVSGLSIRYDVAEADHPLLGLRMPNRELQLTDGRRIPFFELLRAARPVLVTPPDGGELRERAAGWTDRVDVVVGRWVRDPAANGRVDPESVLVRPDGHVVWAAPGGGGDLAEALRRWFGSPGTQRATSTVGAARGPALVGSTD
jgi:hypothetical protein